MTSKEPDFDKDSEEAAKLGKHRRNSLAEM
jgi:hypothetical protein